MKAKRSPTRSRAAAAPTYEELAELVRMVRAAAHFTEFRLRSGDIEIEVRRSNGGLAAPVQPAPAAAQPAAPPVVAPRPAQPKAAPPSDLPEGTVLLRAPMVGTFYRAPEPGAKPFVEPGQRVAADTIVCIIEVMKLMNSIAAGHAGVVTQVYVGNAEPVEYGQPLIAIDTTR